MGTIKISNLSEASDADGVDFCGVQSGATKKVPVAVLDARFSGIQEYMVQLTAEQGGDLLSEGTPLGYEWSFGNGATTHASNNVPTRVTVYVPTGWECHIVAMSFNAAAAVTAEVQASVNTALKPNTSVTLTAAQNGLQELATPEPISNGWNVSFKTISSSAAAGSGPYTVTAWLRYRKV